MFINGSPPSNSKVSTSGKTKEGSVINRTKRAKRSTWGSREWAGMSFLIVVAFYAVFGLIILTEVLMIDERNRGTSVIVRHGSMGSRLVESMPDYDDVKDDYNLGESELLIRSSANKFSGPAAQDTNAAQSAANADFKMSMGIPVMPDTRDIHGNPIPWGQALPLKIEQKLPDYPLDSKPTDGSWQIVNGTRFKFFVFSSFYDRRDGKLIRIIGATKTRNPERVWCRFWFPSSLNLSNSNSINQNSNSNHFNRTHGSKAKFYSISVMARVKVIRENWNLKYSACFILCPLRAAGSEVPYGVSVVSRLRSPPGNILIVRNTDTDPDFNNRSSVNDIPNKIAVCVKPLHFNYDRALSLLEFIELNAIMGVNHFTMYNHTIGPHASCVLQHYMNNQINMNELLGQQQYNNNSSETAKNPKITIDLLPWDLRMRSQKEIRTEGLFAALNDCLYRSMYRYSHVALIDFDEFIIPRHNSTLNELIEWLTKRVNSKNAGAYSFQNAFFYLQFGDDDLMYKKTGPNPQLRSSLVTQRKTRRRSKLHPQKQRSKYICKPEYVIEAGNHFVWEFSPGKGSVNVPSDSAILHHYRVCEFGGDDCIKTPSLIDRTAHKFQERLIKRVDAIYNYLKEPCKLPDLPAQPTPPTKKIVVLKTTFSGNKTNNNKIDKIISNVNKKNDINSNSNNNNINLINSTIKLSIQ